MARTKSLSEWKHQMISDKALFEHSKKPHQNIQTGWKIVNGVKKPLSAVELYGKYYRESKAGYNRALARSKGKRRGGR